VKAPLALLLVAVFFGGCAGRREESAETGREPGAPQRTVTTTRPSSTTEGARPEDVVPPKSALRKIRAIEDRFSRVDGRLDAGVRAVSAFESRVRCWTEAGWRRLEAAEGRRLDGVADPYVFEIHLHPYVCRALDALLAGARPDSGDEALAAATALVILTHEATHLTSAGSNEAVVECRAMQNADQVAVALGLDQAYANELARLYWDEVYPLNAPAYRSDECRDGGVMDVNPGESAWP
jgi:hypothetical protein